MEAAILGHLDSHGARAPVAHLSNDFALTPLGRLGHFQLEKIHIQYMLGEAMSGTRFQPTLDFVHPRPLCFNHAANKTP